MLGSFDFSPYQAAALWTGIMQMTRKFWSPLTTPWEVKAVRATSCSCIRCLERFRISPNQHSSHPLAKDAKAPKTGTWVAVEKQPVQRHALKNVSKRNTKLVQTTAFYPKLERWTSNFQLQKCRCPVLGARNWEQQSSQGWLNSWMCTVEYEYALHCVASFCYGVLLEAKGFVSPLAHWGQAIV